MTAARSATSGEPLRRRHDVLWRTAGETALLLAPDGEQPLVVSGSGAALWEALAEPVCLDSLIETLAARFGVDAEAIRDDVVRGLDDLSTHGLLDAL